MSGGGVKHFFEQPAVEDSRVFAQLGRTFGIPALTAEAKHNEQNPGRAITKAGINAALWYLGGEAGSALGGSGAAADGVNGYADAGVALDQANAANAAMQAGGAAGGLLGNVSGGGSELTASQIQQLALQHTADSGLLGSGSQTITPNNLLQLNQAPVSDLSVQAQAQPLRAAQDYAAHAYNSGRDALSNVFSRGSVPAPEQASAPVYDQSITAARSGNSALKTLARQTGLKMLTPQQQQPAPRGMPAPQGPQGPLPNPYQNNTYGPGGNSMGLTEDQKRRLRAMGYQIP